MIEIEKVTKKIKSTEILKDISFSLRCGEIVGLLGPNGAGKTTLMRAILGLTSISKGDIRFKGNSILTNYNFFLKEVGALIETPKFYPDLSGYENLFYYDILNNRKANVHEIMNSLGLGNYKYLKVKKYSLGMKQRLGIAQAIMHKPQVLILDEPMNALDPSGIMFLKKYIKHFVENKGSVIISSHLISEIESMCDKVLIIDKGDVKKRIIIDEDFSQSGFFSIQVKKQNLNEAYDLLKDSINKAIINKSQSTLEFSCSKDRIPGLIYILLKKNIPVYEVRKLRTPLEEVYFKSIVGS
ncbi:ATP-binding cassette domain-containing protein [Bacillus pumilus]|uniref:ABC transporter ATP-binding protein n=1 Tax=Bacillus TaxID=1386 RepID=UPI001B813C00|nr:MULTISPECIES: ATP-binding cassette domain-containing protein [Bacillus]MBR0620243.1 ATP-binding cassette domain-containing protein [Bacillus pumilus]MCW6698881.1 ATP-binding cassette domain-containing protein [Bacillus sp. RP12]UCZ70869.1 ATP-binding cassette domain-containing protein [Bacillus pumilus]